MICPIQPSLSVPVAEGKTIEVIPVKGCLKQTRIRSKTQRGIDRNNAKKWCCSHPDAAQCRGP